MLQQYIKGISKEELKDNLKGLSNNDLIQKCIIYNFYEFLPRDENGVCFYDGDLILIDCNLKSLPDKLTVNGNLYCLDNRLTLLPDMLRVIHTLDCRSNRLISFPDNLYVGGQLICRNQKSGIKLELPPSINKRNFFN
jgi:hypothetical protein